FYMTNVAPRGVPAIPFVSSFNELNVRTYVTRDGKPGVYFFSLDANSLVAVTAARTLFRLPYFLADMDISHDGGAIAYRSRRTAGDVPAEWRARYRPVGAERAPARGTLEYFLTERYCLYTVDGPQVYRLEIHHRPWPLQGAEATIDVNTMWPSAIDGPPATLHFSKRQDMLAWPLERVRDIQA
ncbi:MAG: YqjF family protein, partial [Vicinamibacterales bacterium]